MTHRLSLSRNDSVYGPLIVYALLSLVYLAAALVRGDPIPSLPPIPLLPQ